MIQNSVEGRISSDPNFDFTLRWDGNDLHLIPTTAIPPGENFIIKLEAGASSADGRKYLKNYEWPVQIRWPRILFLGQPMVSPEIWMFDPENKSTGQITKSGGMITGFSVFPDGSSIIFSRKNNLNGSDLYIIKPDGSDERKIVNCGNDTCKDAVIDKTASFIAFSRNQNPENGEQSKTFHGYIFEISTGITQPLYLVHNIQGDFPTWSPDGKKIAIYDKTSLGIRIRNLDGENDFLLGTLRNQTGSWSADGSKFLFIDDISEEGLTFSKLYEVDLENSSISEPLRELSRLEEFGIPALSPDGKSVVMGVRHIDAEVTKQLWLFDLEKKTRTSITSDSAYTNAAPQWRPDGNALVFQQAQLGSSGIKPSIIVWNKVDNTFKTISNDGALPAWLP